MERLGTIFPCKQYLSRSVSKSVLRGLFGPWSSFGTTRIKIGSLPTFLLALWRVNARPLFGTDLPRLFSLALSLQNPKKHHSFLDFLSTVFQAVPIFFARVLTGLGTYFLSLPSTDFADGRLLPDTTWVAANTRTLGILRGCFDTGFVLLFTHRWENPK